MATIPVQPHPSRPSPQLILETALCSEERTLSIVVACRNEVNHVKAFLNSLLTQDLVDFDWEVIIADGGSDDGTTELLAEVARSNSNITVIENPIGIVSTGLNAAIRQARGNIILRMDAHTEYAPNYVRSCVEALEQTGASNVGGPARTKADGLSARAIQAAYHSPFSTGGARFHDDSFSGYVDTVPYGCWRKETLETLGLFDEMLVRNQDDELNLRITRAGGKIWQSSEIVSWYRPRTTLASLFQQYFQYGFWKVAVIRKHKLPASWRHLMPGIFVLTNLVLLFTTLLAGAFRARTLTREAFYLEIAIFITYLASCLVASCVSAQRFGWRLVLRLPATFVVFHISYGSGFLAGLVYASLARSSGIHLGKVFAGITR
jgi:succinoglycan biosynthesis protein ExoA